MLPGFIKVFSCVGHSTGGPQPLTQRSRGHVHKLLLLLACTYKTCILHVCMFSTRTTVQPWQQLQSVSPLHCRQQRRVGPRTDELHAHCCKTLQVQSRRKALSEHESDTWLQPRARKRLQCERDGAKDRSVVSKLWE